MSVYFCSVQDMDERNVHITEHQIAAVRKQSLTIPNDILNIISAMLTLSVAKKYTIKVNTPHTAGIIYPCFLTVSIPPFLYRILCSDKLVLFYVCSHNTHGKTDKHYKCHCIRHVIFTTYEQT